MYPYFPGQQTALANEHLYFREALGKLFNHKIFYNDHINHIHENMEQL